MTISASLRHEKGLSSLMHLSVSTLEEGET